MKILLLPSLAKVFKDTEPNFEEFTSFSSLKNEKFSFQVAFLAEKKEETKIGIDLSSPLKRGIKLYSVKNMPCEKSGYDYSDSYH